MNMHVDNTEFSKKFQIKNTKIDKTAFYLFKQTFKQSFDQCNKLTYDNNQMDV
jgi:hypothetical protein